jgi:hypothetical protein
MTFPRGVRGKNQGADQAAKLLQDEARRIAVNIAKLLRLIR